MTLKSPEDMEVGHEYSFIYRTCTGDKAKGGGKFKGTTIHDKTLWYHFVTHYSTEAGIPYEYSCFVSIKELK